MKGILLISSGIDSPVAGYLMRKRNVEVMGLHFKLENTIPQIKKLSKKIGIKKVYAINHKEILKEITKNINRRFTCIICKRTMLRIAEKIAKKEKCKLIITGENLGQVASQTLDNMAVIDKAINLTIARPLLCKNKQEIIDIAKKIGTYGVSIERNKECYFLPNNPATTSKTEKIKEEEKRFDLNKIIKNLNMEIIKV